MHMYCAIAHRAYVSSIRLLSKNNWTMATICNRFVWYTRNNANKIIAFYCSYYSILIGIVALYLTQTRYASHFHPLISEGFCLLWVMLLNRETSGCSRLIVFTTMLFSMIHWILRSDIVGGKMLHWLIVIYANKIRSLIDMTYYSDSKSPIKL